MVYLLPLKWHVWTHQQALQLEKSGCLGWLGSKQGTFAGILVVMAIH